MTYNRQRAELTARKSQKNKTPALPCKPAPRRKNFRYNSSVAQNKRPHRRQHSKARSDPSPGRASNRTQVYRTSCRARNKVRNRRENRSQVRSSFFAAKPRSRTVEPFTLEPFNNSGSITRRSLSRRRQRSRRKSRSCFEHENYMPAKRGFLQAVRRKWRIYFSSKKCSSKEKSIEKSEQEVQAEVKAVKSETAVASVEEKPQENSNPGKKSLISIIQDSAAFDSILKTISVCVSTVYENGSEDFYINSLPDPECQINVLYRNDAIHEKQENDNSRENKDKTHGELFFEANQAIVEVGHPEGEYISKKASRKSMSIAAKKSQKPSSLFPNFHETMWELPPNCTLDKSNSKEYFYKAGTKKSLRPKTKKQKKGKIERTS